MKSQFLSAEETVAIVTRFNDALNGRNITTMMQLMTSDCLFENTYPPPDGTRFRGQTAVRAFWEAFFDNSQRAHFDIEEIFACQNHCVMRWAYHWVDQNDQSGHIRGVDVYTLDNGLVSEKLSYVKG
jgi:nuclear transport factor 2 (NTF2) superfamily protein